MRHSLIRCVPLDGRERHAKQLKLGLTALGPEFLASLCYWCEGETSKGGWSDYGHCQVCGRGKPYGTTLGLLQGAQPAPESVVNQVLVAADRVFWAIP